MKAEDLHRIVSRWAPLEGAVARLLDDYDPDATMRGDAPAVAGVLSDIARARMYAARMVADLDELTAHFVACETARDSKSGRRA